MLDIRSFFNILLLGISLSTVLVTLISFIIFKFRYSISSHKNDNLHELEGSFFRRFAPHLAAENKEELKKRKQKKKASMSPEKKILIFFASTFVFIVTMLSAENYFTYRTKLLNRSQSAEDIRGLLAKGLLKKHEFDASFNKVSMNQFIPSYIQSQYKRILERIKKFEVNLIVDGEYFKNVNGVHPKAAERWKRFLQRNKIKFKTKNLKQVSSFGLHIFPQMTAVPEVTREKVLKEIEVQNASFLFTGYAGEFLNSKTKSEKLFLEEIGLAEFQRKKEGSAYLPTQLIGQRDLPPGLVLSLTPLNNDYWPVKVKTELLSLSRISDYYSGRPGYGEYKRDIIDENKKLSWSEVDPIDDTETSNTQLFYSDFYFLTLLASTLQVPSLNLATWKLDKYKSSATFGVDSEDEFHNVNKYMKLFREFNIPGSFFMVSNFLKGFETNLKEARFFEFGTHTLDHAVMTEKSIENNFNDLNTARLLIEERTHRPVLGIRPPEEKIDEKVLAAIVQNKFEYIFGPKSILQFYPFLVGQGELVFIPRTLRDDINFEQDKLLVSPEDIANQLKLDFEWISSANGLHALSLHTHVFGDDFYFGALTKWLADLQFLKEKTWITSMGEVSKWLKDKSRIDLELIVKGDSSFVRIKNLGEGKVEGFDVVIHNASKINSHCKEKSSVKRDRLIANIETIEAKSTLDVKICH